jgi:hypothetical protein
LKKITEKSSNLKLIHKIAGKYDINRAGQLAGRRPFWHLLNGHSLIVFVNRQSKFGGEGISSVILKNKFPKAITLKEKDAKIKKSITVLG